MRLPSSTSPYQVPCRAFIKGQRSAGGGLGAGGAGGVRGGLAGLGGGGGGRGGPLGGRLLRGGGRGLSRGQRRAQQQTGPHGILSGEEPLPPRPWVGEGPAVRGGYR